MVDHKSNMNQKCDVASKITNTILCCINGSVCSTGACTHCQYASAGTVYPDQVVIQEIRKETGDEVRGEQQKMIKGLECKPCKEKQRELGMLSLEKKEIEGEHDCNFQIFVKLL